MTSRSPWSRAALGLSLLVVPVLLFGPILAAGQVFLPFLPTKDEPLASENPSAAAEARRALNPTMGDRVYPFLTDQIAARAELRAGHLPTWEPLQTLGMPLFGGNVAALGYPPNALAFLIPPERAAAPLALLALFLAGLGTWLFLRRIELDPRACLVGALGVELGAWGLANLHYYMKVDAALWFPWALWAIEGFARRKRWSALALAGSLALSFLGGMVSISVFVLLGSALYALVRLAPRAADAHRRSGPRALFGAGILLALGVAGSAYWTWPLAEAARASLRGPATVATNVALSLPPTTALGVLVPELAGAADDPTSGADLPLAWWLTPGSMSERAELANVLEWNTYALVTLVLLALVAVVATPRRALFPALLLLASHAFAQAWPLVRTLYALPGLGLGAPGRVLALAWILWPWLAALGVEALLARAPRALPALLASAFAAALLLLALRAEIGPERWAAELQHTLQARYPQYSLEQVDARLPLAADRAAAEHLRESLARAGAAALAVLLAGSAALLLDRRRPRFEQAPRLGALALGLALPLAAGLLPFALCAGFAARGPQALLGLSAVLAITALGARSERSELALWLPLAALVLLEGFLGSYAHVRGRSLLGAELFPPSPSIEALREAAGDGRVLRLDPSGTLAEAIQLARPNMLVPYGIADLTPYPTFTPREPVELVERLDPAMRVKNHVGPLPRLELVERPLLDLLRVSCVLSLRALQHPRLVPILERPGFCVYRRLGALSAARMVPAALASASDEEVVAALVAPDADYARVTRIAPEDGARIARFTSGPDWKPGRITAVEHPAKNRVRVRVEDSRGGWLVVHEQWARGWRAAVDGAPAELLRADHAYRALFLPPKDGTLVVELEYAPRALESGAALALVALLGVLAFELLNRGE